MKKIFDRCFNSKPNILTFCTHERYQSNMSDIYADFYLLSYNGSKKWHKEYAGIPENHFFLPSGIIPSYLSFDFILSQSKYSHYEQARKISHDLGIPLVCLEHTLPTSNFNEQEKKILKSAIGHYNIYISNYNYEAWGKIDNSFIIPHCVDPIFEYSDNHTENAILAVQNDYINRSYCLNYNLWKSATKDLPVKLIGNTPGLSEAAKNVHELIEAYQKYSIYFNTAHESPIPSSLLEAMACGMAVVSVATCAIPEYIKHEENGFLVSSLNEAVYYLNLLLKNEKLRRKLGESARKTIEEKCNKKDFTTRWNKVIQNII